MRYKTDDQFWFSFFHEAGHILRSRRRDFIDVDAEQDDEDKDAVEAGANRYARNLLIPPEDYNTFCQNADFSARAIRAFAANQG